jgi:hypothetical protein
MFEAGGWQKNERAQVGCLCCTLVLGPAIFVDHSETLCYHHAVLLILS